MCPCRFAHFPNRRRFSSSDRSGSHNWCAALNDSRRPIKTVISLVLFCEFFLAIAYGTKRRPPRASAARRLAQTSHAYPTWSLAIQQAAAQFFGTYGGRTARPASQASGESGPGI